MKKTLIQHFKKYGPYWAIFVLSATYLLLNWNRYFVLYSWADVDDTMQYNLSKSMSEGQWLGPYTRATLIKGIIFPAWTALLHMTHTPLWLGGIILMLLACLAIIYALRRLITNKWVLTAIYGLLLLNPVITDRAYRDYITPAVALFVCTWAIGMFVTIIKARENRKTTVRDSIIFTFFGFITLPAWYNLREDGYWIMPIVGGLFAIAIISFLSAIQWKVSKHILALGGIVAMIMVPFIATSLLGAGIANLNEKYYGRNVLNDYFSSDFEDAYAALTRVDTDNKRHLTVPVSTAMREQIYIASPAFLELKDCLDREDKQGLCEGFKQNGVDAEEINDYQGGWLPFAIRLAVDNKGYYATASTAEKYYRELARQVNTACDTGALSCHDAHVVSLLPTPNPTIINALFTSNSSSIFSMGAYLQLLSKDGYSSDYTKPATAESQALNEMAAYYGVRYTKPSMYSTIGSIKNAVTEFTWIVYKILTPFLMYGSILVTLLASYLYLRGLRFVDWKLLTIAWLLIATIGIRLAMLAYVYTVHFPTTSNIYFAPVYTLLFLFEGVGIAIALSMVKKIQFPKNKS